MCLTYRMYDDEIQKFKGVHEGWKQFVTIEGKLYPLHMNNRNPLPRGKWLKEEDYRPNWCAHRKTIDACDDFPHYRYPMGFHVWLKSLPQEGVWRTILRVRFRKPVVWGIQDGKPVVVAKEIFIPKE